VLAFSLMVSPDVMTSWEAYSSTFFVFAAHYEDCLVSFCHFSHRCVSADELTERDFNVKLRAQLECSSLVLPPTFVTKM
jgi:hypothetical protein